MPGVPLAGARLELDDGVGHVLEKAAVVGDDQHARVRQAQKSLEPLDRFKVEVVGGFVEHEQVGVLQQQLGERESPALPAAQRARRERLIGLGQADPVEDLGDPVVVGVAIEALVLVLDVAVLLEQRRHLGGGRRRHRHLQLLQALAEADDVRAAV